jgi:uncharacterized protein YciI
MLFAIVCEDQPGSLPQRRQARPAHLQRLTELQAEGRLVLAGPFPAVECDDPGEAGFLGSLIVAEFDSLAAAREWAEADPYRLAGVYARVNINPFKQVFPS